VFVKSQKEAWEDEKPLTRGTKLSAFLALNNLLRARLAYSKIPEPVVAKVGALHRSVPSSDVFFFFSIIIFCPFPRSHDRSDGWPIARCIFQLPFGCFCPPFRGVCLLAVTISFAVGVG
jgi:hypothetical protein